MSMPGDRDPESVEKIVEPPEGDPADLTEQGASEMAGKMEDEVDDLAASHDPGGLGHGPNKG